MAALDNSDGICVYSYNDNDIQSLGFLLLQLARRVLFIFSRAKNRYNTLILEKAKAHFRK